jgi:hypothetical protein
MSNGAVSDGIAIEAQLRQQVTAIATAKKLCRPRLAAQGMLCLHAIDSLFFELPTRLHRTPWFFSCGRLSDTRPGKESSRHGCNYQNSHEKSSLFFLSGE